MTTPDAAVAAAAPAKINLTLHVTGQRDDGYHLLDSLVLFTDVGDQITVQPADTLSLTINGPFAAGLSTGADNLVLRAAQLFGTDYGAAITLTKNLPVASGIGGGSTDAAAALRALSTLWGVPLPDTDAILSLGADVPVCLALQLTRMSGIGDQIERLGAAPARPMILVNPGVGVSTPAVFSGLAQKTNAPMTAMPAPVSPDWLGWLAEQRNDLEGPARAVAPVISAVLGDLRGQPGCALARMSGSGATCFAIFDDVKTRDSAAITLRNAHPDWWVAEASPVSA